MADITLEKNLPHNLDAERSILGSILLENSSINMAQELLNEADFYRDSHRKLFRVMENLTEGSNVIDLITVVTTLTSIGLMHAISTESERTECTTGDLRYLTAI